MDRAGADGVDGEVKLFAAKVHRHAAGQADDAVLGSDIGRVAGRCAEAFGRGDVHDAAEAGLAHVRQGGAGGALVAGQHDIEGRVPGLFIGVAIAIDRRHHREPGIIDEDFEAAEMVCGLIDDALDGGGIRDVERPAANILEAGIPDLLYHLVDGLLLEVCHGDIGAFMGEEVCGCAAHAGSGAGDEGGLAFDRAGQGLVRGHAVLRRFISRVKYRLGRREAGVNGIFEVAGYEASPSTAQDGLRVQLPVGRLDGADRGGDGLSDDPAAHRA